MNAKICDKCGAMWVDQDGCEVEVINITLSKSNSHSDKIADYDLCEPCRIGLFKYLKPNTEKES